MKTMHKVIKTQVTTTPAMKNMAEAISKKAGSCQRNSVSGPDGVGFSIGHGYNVALLMAAEAMGLADLTKQSDWYKQYKSKY